MEIPNGSIYAIIGRSGAGKSCLLKLLIGLMQPDAGEVWVDDTEISRLRGRALNAVRTRFSMLFQGGALFDSLSVYDNVAFPLREKTRLRETIIREKVHARLTQVGLAGVDEKFPAELSGGMRKRVAMARALVSEPELLLFDEPTTGLDPIRVNAIHQLIHDLHEMLHFTAVIVSHEIPEIRSAMALTESPSPRSLRQRVCNAGVIFLGPLGPVLRGINAIAPPSRASPRKRLRVTGCRPKAAAICASRIGKTSASWVASTRSVPFSLQA